MIGPVGPTCSGVSRGMHLAGKRILVTGGTDGIGAALIRTLRDRGAEVITHGRSPDRVSATRAAGFDAHCAKPLTPERIIRVLETAASGVLPPNP